MPDRDCDGGWRSAESCVAVAVCTYRNTRERDVARRGVCTTRACMRSIPSLISTYHIFTHRVTHTTHLRLGAAPPASTPTSRTALTTLTHTTQRSSPPCQLKLSAAVVRATMLAHADAAPAPHASPPDYLSINSDR